MESIRISITKEFDKKEIKAFLKTVPGLSARIISNIKQNNGIRLNGESVTARHMIKEGDVLELIIPPERSENIEPVYIKLDILYEDDEILAVNKPSGMPTHPSYGNRLNTLANAVMYYLGEGAAFHAITRLDKNTSGCVIIAKNKISANLLTRQMKENRIKKTYYAICIGELEKKEGIINAPIARSRESVIKREISPTGKEAVTRYEVICEKGGFSLLRLFPETGRTHQIRLHLSYIGHPVYSDFLYGTEINGERTRLHCGEVEFFKPDTGERIKISAPLADDFFLPG